MVNRRRTFIAVATSALLLPAFMAPAASAQDSENSLKNLLACDKIKKASEKLECFNAIVELLKQDQGSSSLGSNNRNSRDNFGFNQAEIEKRENKARSKRGLAKKAPAEKTFTIARRWKDPVGKQVFLLENGQVWKETDGSRMPNNRKSKTIRIKKAWSGGYRAYFEGKTGFGRIKRIR